MNSLTITPRSTELDIRVSIPGSKSITNRAMICAALAEGESLLTNALFSDDTRYMAEALKATGIPVETDPEACTIRIVGGGGSFGPTDKKLHIGNAGTAMRFLTAALTLGQGKYTLDGIARMRERPIKELTDALGNLGAEIRSTLHEGHPPLEITGGTLQGGRALFSGKISSQFISAIMLAAPYAKEIVHIDISREPVSRPYLEMTAQVMEDFGVSCRADEYYKSITINPGTGYSGHTYSVESDASSASYFFAAAAVAGGTVTVEGLSRDSIQGDIGFVDALVRMGCNAEWGENYVSISRKGPLKGIEIDMRHISDTALTLCAVALYAEGPTRISGVANMRVKETDRISALCKELSRMGAHVDEHEDGLTIHPTEKYHHAKIETYDDHRMAMSFAVAALGTEGITILDPGCTAKTFPDFFKRFAPCTGGIH